MDIRVLETLFEKIRNYCLEGGDLKTVRFVWHGGEPLFINVSFYYKMLDLQERLLSDLGVVIEHSIQSNLLLLNKEKIELLKILLKNKNGTYNRVGTSIDPVPGIRVVKGYDYEKKWFDSLALLRESGLQYGAILVVHKHHLAIVDRVYSFFSSLYDSDGANTRFNPLYNSGRAKTLKTDIHLTPREWGQFMIDFYRLWEKDGKVYPFIPFQEYEEYHHAGKSRMSCDSSGRCMKTHAGIDVDGSVYLCGRSMDDKFLYMGNIATHSLKEIVNSPERIKLQNRVVFLKESLCRQCKWWAYCHGGCPNESLSYFDTLAAKSNWCAGRLLFFNTIFKEPRELSEKTISFAMRAL